MLRPSPLTVCPGLELAAGCQQEASTASAEEPCPSSLQADGPWFTYRKERDPGLVGSLCALSEAFVKPRK